MLLIISSDFDTLVGDISYGSIGYTLMSLVCSYHSHIFVRIGFCGIGSEIGRIIPVKLVIRSVYPVLGIGCITGVIMSYFIGRLYLITRYIIARNILNFFIEQVITCFSHSNIGCRVGAVIGIVCKICVNRIGNCKISPGK